MVISRGLVFQGTVLRFPNNFAALQHGLKYTRARQQRKAHLLRRNILGKRS
jgi:hypothetical protein